MSEKRMKVMLSKDKLSGLKSRQTSVKTRLRKAEASQFLNSEKDSKRQRSWS